MKKYILFPSILLASYFLTGCSTMMHGTTQTVDIASIPNSANVSIDRKYVGRTPMNVKLSRKNTHLVSIEHEGYKTYEIALEKNISAWALGNVALGGLLGVGVDAVTGGLYNLSPSQIQAELLIKEVVSCDPSPEVVQKAE